MSNERIESQGVTILRLKNRIAELEKNNDLNKQILLKIKSGLASESKNYTLMKISDMKEVIDLFLEKYDCPTDHAKRTEGGSK